MENTARDFKQGTRVEIYGTKLDIEGQKGVTLGKRASNAGWYRIQLDTGEEVRAHMICVRAIEEK